MIRLGNQFSHGLLKLGVKPGDKVATIVKENRPEWNICDFGISQIGAINVYSGRNYSWPTASPNQRAVFATVLAANGQIQQARQVIANVASDRLRPEEQALISSLLR
jgi:long-subunit acyl-CoA synthetase (AMP-forming)